MSNLPNGEELTTDSVIDAIAMIELQRQDLGREPNPEAWRNQAIGKLQEILRQLEEAIRLHGPSAEHHANAEAVRNAINRVNARGSVVGQHAGQKGGQRGGERGGQRGQPQKPRPPHHGRRQPGRRGGR